MAVAAAAGFAAAPAAVAAATAEVNACHSENARGGAPCQLWRLTRHALLEAAMENSIHLREDKQEEPSSGAEDGGRP
jgi:hypothetical protein